MGIATPSAARRRRLLLPAAALGVSGLLLTACGAPPEQSEACLLYTSDAADE